MTAPGHPEDGERGSNAAREGVASRAASRAPSTARAQTRFGAARHSGLGRRTALLAGAGTAAIALTAGTLLYEASGTLEATLAERTAQRARESGTELRVAVATLRDDVQLLASTSFIQGIIRARGAGGIDPQDGVVEEIWRARVGAALARLLEVKPRYTEARLVSRDSADFDTVRVVRDGTRIARAAGDALRAERDDAFLSGVLEGRGGPVALDEVRLARARGQLIHPARAELRAAVPVYDASRAPGERLFGAIVLSLDVGGTLASADRPGAASTLRYAVNDRGDFLLHPEPGHAFAFEMGAPRRIQAELAGSGAAFAALPGTDDLSTFTEDTGSDRATFAFRRVRFDPLRPERFIGLVHALSHDDTAAAAQAWLARSLAVVGVVAAAVMLLVAWLCAAWSRGLVSLAAAVETYAGREAVPLPVDARDETGSIARAFASVVARLAERESRAIESEQRLRGVIETAPDAIVTIDARGIIQAVNPAVERMFQYAPDELRGRNVSCLMPAPFRDEHDGYLARHMATGASGIIGRGRAVEGLRRDGTRIPVFLSVGRFEIAGRALFTGILRDVSEIRATEASLREANADLAAQSVRATDLAALSSAAQESVAPDALARRALGEVLRVTGAVAGAIHLVEETSVRTLASVAFDTSRGPHERFEVRDGLIGQCIAERAAVRVDACPPSYFRIASGLGAHVPHVLLLCPMVRRDAVIAVLELASFDPGHLDTRGYLDAACELLASALGAARLRERESQLLAAAQRQADTLQAQQEELQSTNEELEQQAEELRASREELRAINVTLEEQARTVERERATLAERNLELARTRCELEERAEALAAASRYKSEFLANMSHELRTPLNSSLILAQLLAENREGNLTDKQVEFAEMIRSAGDELLGLINDVLDLAKVEAGKLTIEAEETPVSAMLADVERRFAAIAHDAGLGFSVDMDGDAPETLHTDGRRVAQILRNLLANAFKFCPRGSVSLCARTSPDPRYALALSVSDTGIGIPSDKLSVIFEAFQQADGSTSRRFGGTGLGLSISRELARTLGGKLRVESEEGRGSTFTLLLPARHVDATADPARFGKPGPAVAAQPRIKSERRVVLVVEDDPKQRYSLEALLASSSLGLSVVTASTGEAALARIEREPPACVVVDLGLPDLSGFELLERMGARGARTPAALVYTGRDLTRDEELRLARSAQQIIVKGVRAPERLVEELTALLAAASAQTESSVSASATARCELAEPAADARATLAAERLAAARAHETLDGKTVLLVDDDVRNVFVLTEVLERAGMTVRSAADGAEALAKLDADSDVDAVLVDIMMPVMDGYTCIARLRSDARFRDLPIIALTAKAMKGDRELCLRAGANDYVSKPVDVAALLRLLHAWTLA
jgi:two-component system chemotaxis sensor kinase CheA